MTSGSTFCREMPEFSGNQQLCSLLPKARSCLWASEMINWLNPQSCQRTLKILCLHSHPITWAAFSYTWSARAQFVPLQHRCPFIEDSVLHGRFRVSDTRTSQCGSCSTDQQHHHCLPRVIRTHTALCICMCCRKGRLTGEGVCCILAQAPA